MQAVIRSRRDLYLGLIYTAVGVGAFLIGLGYPFGSATRMGAGFFPVIVAGMLALFGIGSLIRAVIHESEAIDAIAWRGLILVVAAIVAFALLIDTAGFAIAAVALLILCATASREFRFRWVPTLAALALVAVCTFVFVLWLGIPMPLTGPWLQPWLGGWPQ